MGAPSTSTLFLGLILMTLGGHCYGHLKVGFYDGKCGTHDVEKVIFGIVKQKITADPDTVSDLVRLSFHDCFVRGCDASILLTGKDVEQTAKVNKGLGGIQTVSDLKTAVEKVCPGVVSCADTLVIGARAAISLAGGKWFEVETGRRDGRISRSSEAQAIIPSPRMPVPQAIELFASKGLNKDDFVVLLGGHTVGTAHCHSFKERLYNFHNTRKPDTAISSTLLKLLQNKCPLHSHKDEEAFLDQTPNSHFTIDNDYYKQILLKKGTMEIDSNLALSPLTRGIVKELAYSPNQFLNQFGSAMVKMARIGVLTGYEGEIRKVCSSVN